MNNADTQTIYNGYMEIFKAIFAQYDYNKAKKLLLLIFANTIPDVAQKIIKDIESDAEIKEVITNTKTKEV